MLLGLILAFQSAIPMRRFGADISSPISGKLAMLREIGLLITAIILAAGPVRRLPQNWDHESQRRNRRAAYDGGGASDFGLPINA